MSRPTIASLTVQVEALTFEVERLTSLRAQDGRLIQSQRAEIERLQAARASEVGNRNRFARDMARFLSSDFIVARR